MILIQQASGEYQRMIAHTQTLHERVIEAQGGRCEITLGALQKKRHPNWDKTLAILAAMERADENELCIWLDSDAVIVGAEPLARALPEGAELGMVENNYGAFNAGAVWMRHTPRVREFWRSVWDTGPREHHLGWIDQHIINERLRAMRIPFAALNRRWNDYRYAIGRRDAKVVVRAFHGEAYVDQCAGVSRAVMEGWKRRGVL